MAARSIKLFQPYVTWRAIWNVVQVLRGTQLAEGPKVKEFEAKFATRFNLPRALAVNSGTAALELAYEVAGIGPGDEVITPVLTCTATNIPLIHRGATIVFADTDKDLNINIADVERKITPKTKAIVFVHFGGNNRGLKELLEIAKRHSILLIEDAAQAVGSDFWGKADITCVSFQAIKALTTGDGGMLICRDEVMHHKARRLRWFGYDREVKHKNGDTDLTEAGYKYHMNDISAAIGLGNLKAIDKIINHQRNLIRAYAEHGIVAHPWFAVVLSDSRTELKEFLSKHSIESGTHHYRNDKYTLFGGRKSFPVMDEIEEKYLLLPLHMHVSISDAHRICTLVKTFEKTEA